MLMLHASARSLKYSGAVVGCAAAICVANGQPGDEALHKTCFPCHEPAKASDFVFTHYAPTP
jgi:hypothetical protein